MPPEAQAAQTPPLRSAPLQLELATETVRLALQR